LHPFTGGGTETLKSGHRTKGRREGKKKKKNNNMGADIARAGARKVKVTRNFSVKCFQEGGVNR